MHRSITRLLVAALHGVSRCRIVTTLTICAVILPAVSAADSSATGTIEGRVFNASSGLYVNNARVAVEGTSIEDYTDETGSYRLRNVPVGEVKLKITFSGQNDIVEVAKVEPDVVSQRNFTFAADQASIDKETGAYKLDTFVVESQRYRNAQEIATNEERATVNIKSVVALDTLGYIRDGNIGEFVRFLPGVDVSNGDLGAGSNPDNAANVAVRGFGADSTLIMVDGVPLASGSPNALTRTVQLDGLSVNNASRLEIIKVATPDMSSDTPGGAINLITRGAFELSRANYQLSLAFNGSTLTPDVFKKTPGPYEANYKTLPSVRFSGAIPLSDKFGVSFSLASDNKYSLTNTSNMRGWLYTGRNTTGSGVSAPVANAQGGIRINNPLIERFEIVENQWIENRQSGNLRLDWRPFPGLEIRANGQLSLNDGTGVVRRTQWRYGTNTAVFGVKDWGADYVTGYQRTPTYTPTGLNASMTVDARDREGFTSQGYITLKFHRGPWSIDAGVTASESYTNAPDWANRHFSSVDASITPGRMDLAGIDNGMVGRINLWDANANPIDYGRLAAWNSILVLGGDFRARTSQSSNRDLTKQYRLDVSRDLEFMPFPVTLKAGAVENEKSNHRFGRGATYEMRYIGPTIANADIESAYTSESKYGYAGPQRWVDPHTIYEIFAAHPEYFTDSLISAPLNVHLPASNYLSKIGNAKGLTETSTEWYGMATAKLFHNRMTVIAGARQSHKERKGYNVFNDPTYQYVKMPDGTLYRDSVYTQGVRFDGNPNAAYPTGDARRAADVVMTDAALRTRMQSAGVEYLPTKLELAPNGTAIGNMNQNLFMAMRARSTRNVDAALTAPWTPQVQVAYEVTDSLRLQVAWSKEHRLPDLEGGTNTLLVQGASFQITENLNPTSDPGGEGTMVLANLTGKPEINESYNVKLAYYPTFGRGGERRSYGKYSISYYYKTVDNSWTAFDSFNTDSNYDSLLESLGLSASDYSNYKIQTILPLPNKQIRKGFEIEIEQNMGLFSDRLRGIDLFATYTRRPVTARTGGESIVGWIPLTPVRAKWTGGVSFSTRRFSVQSRFVFTEAGITHGSSVSAVQPDGTTKNIQLYNMNEVPPEVNVQANYVLSKHLTLFATANRVISESAYERISDDVTGFMPEWATWRRATSRGIALSAGVTASF